MFGRPGGSVAAVSGPAAGVVTASWEHPATASAVLTHYDFWSGNTLWEDGVLTGVVDWSGGAIGPRGFDVGWCRLDLYLLYDERIASVFLDSYESACRSALPDVLWWDLWAVSRSHADVESWVISTRCRVARCRPSRNSDPITPSLARTGPSGCSFGDLARNRLIYRTGTISRDS